MPKTKKSGAPKTDELPSTLQKSSKKAQRTFAKAYDSAIDEYGDEKRAHKVAWSAVKEKYQRVGKKWKRKDKDEKASSSGSSSKNGNKTKATSKSGGKASNSAAANVDADSTKDKLMKVARRLDIQGRSKMKKRELLNAIKKAK